MENTTAANTADIARIIESAAKFRSAGLAESYMYRVRESGAKGGAATILGDDGRYWVLTAGGAATLHRAGYDYAV